MRLTSEYDIGDRVYLRTREEKTAGLITAIRFNGAGGKLVSYHVSWSDTSETVHYDFEITKEYIKTFTEE